MLKNKNNKKMTKTKNWLKIRKKKWLDLVEKFLNCYHCY